MIKNKYILVEEVKQLLDKIQEKHFKLKHVIILIYQEGYKLGIALKESRYNYNIRTAQRVIKKISKGKITFQDLRRSYLFSHPDKLIRNKKYNKERIISPRIRWSVLARDNFRCVHCGKTSQEELLHVDHIIPISKGGKSKLDNLRTLCSICNMGRGNLMIDLK